MTRARPFLRASALASILACAPSASGGEACEGRVDALRAAFAGLPQVVHDLPGLEVHLDGFGPGLEGRLATPPRRPLDLPRAAGGQAVGLGVVIVMRQDGRMLDALGQALDSPQAAAEHVEIGAGGLKGDRRPDDRPPLLAFEAGAPLRAVAALVPLLADARTSPGGEPLPAVAAGAVLLTSPPGDRPPTEDALPAWMRTRVAALRKKLQDDMGARVLDPLAVDLACPALQPVLAEIEDQAGPRRFLEMLRRLPPVIERDCRCEGVDVEGLAAWMWVAREPWHPVVHGHPWAFGDAGAEVVQFPADATVADLLPVVDARAGEPLRIAVAPG